MNSPGARTQSLFMQATAKIDAELELHFWRWAVVIVLAFLACSLIRDARNKMWLDELYTLYVARQAGPREIARAIIEGIDGAPPVYALMVHSILPVIRREELAVRLPSTLGYCGMVLCLLSFCRRRMPGVYALAASLTACDASRYYATEGRGYGIVMCGAAGALLSWQAAAEGRRRMPSIAMLTICLAAIVALHYYAIFFLGPLLVGELVRWRESGKLDFAVLAAMLPALAVLGLHYPFIEASRKLQVHPWSPASWNQIGDFYIQHFLPFAPLVLIAAAVFAALATDRSPASRTMPRHEWAAVIALALMPAIAVAVARFTTHVFVDRYTLWAMIGFALLSGGALCAATRRRPAVGVVILGLVLPLLALHSIRNLRGTPLLRAGEIQLEDLGKLPGGPEPIVVSDNFAYMEMAYYAGPGLRQRLVYPVDAELELRDMGYDNVALLMSALSHRTNLRITPYDSVLAAYPRFLLSAIQTEPLPRHLLAAGYRLTAIAPTVYQVEAPGLH